MLPSIIHRTRRTFATGARLALLGTLTALLGACATAVTTAPPSDAGPEADFTDEYRIGVGDSLRVNVWRNDDLSVAVPVRPDGKISVPLAGDVMVGGKTPEEVSATVTERLAKFIRDPYVTVIVTNVASDEFRSRVRVTGAVQNPLSIPYRQGMTVLDLVLEAGGTNEFANANRSVLYRRNGDRVGINLNRILKVGDMQTNLNLRPGDVLTIPERAF
ncbi:MAG: XrtA/PEP-CTERM system exopolysaccharide export protein [Pseudomonadota bacterium]